MFNFIHSVIFIPSETTKKKQTAHSVHSYKSICCTHPIIWKKIWLLLSPKHHLSKRKCLWVFYRISVLIIWSLLFRKTQTFRRLFISLAFFHCTSGFIAFLLYAAVPFNHAHGQMHFHDRMHFPWSYMTVFSIVCT